MSRTETLKTFLPCFIKRLKCFNHELSCTDHVWSLCFPDKNGEWFQIRVIKYQKIYWLHHVDGNICSLEYSPGKDLKVINSLSTRSYEEGRDNLDQVWLPILEAASRYMSMTLNNWVRTNKQIQTEYPFNRRYGIVPNVIIRDSLKDIIRIDKNLGKRNCQKFIRLVEENYFSHSENTTVSSFTANKYFEYCRIAYIAAKRKEDVIDTSLDGREMYKKFADGRHDGLLEIDGDSEQEFADWIDGNHPKKARGGHPWEIKRGGNTTHIDLSVFRNYPSFPTDKEIFNIQLRGESFNRLEETIRMFLAIHDASLPISIENPEGIRKRLLGQDNIGIVPCFESLHRANQRFKKEDCVFDVMYLDDLGRSKRRALPFVTWEPLPLMTVRDC